MLALSPPTLTNADRDIKIGDVKTEDHFMFTKFNHIAPLIFGCCPSSQGACQRASLTVLATAGSRLPLHQAQEALNTLKEAQIERSVHTPSGAAAGGCVIHRTCTCCRASYPHWCSIMALSCNFGGGKADMSLHVRWCHLASHQLDSKITMPWNN